MNWRAISGPPVEAGRDRAVEDDPPPAAVGEAETRGVQADAVERVVPAAVRPVADDRMAQRRELRANLPAASSRQRELEQRRVGLSPHGFMMLPP